MAVTTALSVALPLKLTVAVEAKLALELGTTVILPAAIRYQTELAQNVAALKAAGVEPSTACTWGATCGAAATALMLFT